MTALDDMFAHAKEGYPFEVCGLVVQPHGSKRPRLVRARNLSPHPRQHVLMDPDVWIEAGEIGEVIGTYHSHPDGSAEPGITDLQWCEDSALPMYIVGYPSGDMRQVQPTGYKAPYTGRLHLYGVQDCFALVQEWLRREEGIDVPRVPTTDGWWTRGENHIVDNYKRLGFVEVTGEPQRGDVLVLTVGGAHSHLGVYLGNNLFLHQPRSSVSCEAVYGQHWRASTHMVLRYKRD